MPQVLLSRSCALALALCAQADCAGETSDAGPAIVPGPLTARTNLGAAFGSDGRAYLIGGTLLDGGVTGLVEAVEVDAGRISAVPGLPTPRTALAVVASQSGATIFALGGFDSNNSGVATVEALDVPSQKWSRLPALPTAAGALGALALSDGDLLMAIVGVSPAAITVFDGGGWSPLGTPGSPFAAGGVQVAATREGPIWILESDVSDRELLSLVSSADRLTWDAGPRLGYGQRGLGYALTQSGGDLFAFGGAFCGVDFCDGSAALKILTPGSDAGWIAGPNLPAKRDGFAAAVGPDGRIYAFAGQRSDGLHATQTHPAPYAFTALETYDVYDPAAGRWEPTHR